MIIFFFLAFSLLEDRTSLPPFYHLLVSTGAALVGGLFLLGLGLVALLVASLAVSFLAGFVLAVALFVALSYPLSLIPLASWLHLVVTWVSLGAFALAFLALAIAFQR